MPTREWKYKSVDLSAGTQTLESVPCLVKSAKVTTALSAHVCEIDDDTTNVLAFPASSQIGDCINDDDGIRFETSLIVTPNASATGRITITYRRLREQ